MPKASPIQTSFNGGIQSPLLEGHIDAPRRDISVADSTNLIPLKHGPMVRRGGTKHVAPLRVSSGPAYLYAFEFNDEEAYILEFTEDPIYGSIMRVYRNHAMVFKADRQRIITGITDDPDPVVTVSVTLPDTYAANSIVYISGLSEATELNDRFWRIKSRLTPTTFEIQHYDGTSSIGGLSAAETIGGLVDRPANHVLPFCTGEMFRTDGSFIPKLVQSNDVLYMVHPDYAPRVITRTANDVWTIAVANQDDGPYLTNTTGINITNTFSAGIAAGNYFATAGTISSNTLIPVKYTSQIISITKGVTPNVNVTAHGFSTGDVVKIDDLITLRELNGKEHTITVVDANNFTLDNVDTTNFLGAAPASQGIAYIPNQFAVATDKAAFARTDATYTSTINYITNTSPAILDMRAIPTVGANAEIVDGDKILVTGVATMWEVNLRTFTVDAIAYNQRPVITATNATPAVFTANAHGLSAGNTVFLDNLAGGTWSTLNSIYYTVTAPVNVNDFTLTDPDGVAVDGAALGVYTGSSGTANTTQMELDDPCSGVALDAIGYTGAGTGGTIKRGETDRLMRIKFENNTSKTVWLWGRITGFTNSKQITWTIDADSRVPELGWCRQFRDDFHGNGIYPTGPGGGRELNQSTGVNATDNADEWQLGAYSDTTGYPSVITIHQGRVVMGASDNYTRRIDFTQTGGFDTTSINFAPTTQDGQVVDNMAISLEVGGGDGSPVQWIQSIDRGLGVGSTNNEGIIKAGGAGAGSSITPGNATFDVQSSAGSSSLQPIVVGKSLLHVQRVGRRVYELAYGIENDGYSALDLTELAEHLTRSGIIDFAWQQNPINTLWCVLDNGGLIALTYERAANVVGWHHHTLGGDNVSVDSVAVIPDPDLERDEVWLSVSRDIKNDGQYPWTQAAQQNRYIEYMDRWYEDDMGIRNAYHVDSGKSYIEASAAIDSIGLPTGTEPILAISTSGVVEVTNKELFEGAYVYIDDVCGMEDINGKVYKLGPEVISGTYFYNLLDVDGNDLDVAVLGTYTSGGVISVVGDAGIAEYTISGISKAATAIVTTTVSHGYKADDIIHLSDIVDMDEVNNRDFTVGAVTATTFELSGINSSGYATAATAGTTTRYPTPYIEVTDNSHGLSNDDVVIFDGLKDMTGLNGRHFKVSHSLTDTFRIKYLDGTPVQNYTTDSLLKFGALTDDSGANNDEGTWQQCKNTFEGLDHIEGQTVEVIHDGRRHVNEIVCGGKVQLGTKNTVDITNIIKATPPVVTAAGHGFSDGDIVFIQGVQGMTQLNNGCFIVDSATVDTFELDNLQNDDLPAAGYGDYICNGTATVSNLDKYGANVHIGLPNSWHMETLRLEAGSADGTAQGKIKRFEEVIVRLRDTLGLQYGPDANTLEEAVFENATTSGSTPALFTGDKKLRWNGGYETEGKMYFKGEGPYPVQIQSIMPQVNTQDG